MINRENFNETFKYISNNVVVQIIDLFIEIHDQDLKYIEQCILDKDFINLNFHAHHLKGSMANFMDPEATELILKLEEMGLNNSEEELAETFAKLKTAVKVLVQELHVKRKELLT
jgi:HPt (histidine-containing phosphotransfer) domain-containing protein